MSKLFNGGYDTEVEYDWAYIFGLGSIQKHVETMDCCVAAGVDINWMVCACQCMQLRMSVGSHLLII